MNREQWREDEMKDLIEDRKEKTEYYRLKI